jgi:hypothetical protein
MPNVSAFGFRSVAFDARLMVSAVFGAPGTVAPAETAHAADVLFLNSGYDVNNVGLPKSNDCIRQCHVARARVTAPPACAGRWPALEAAPRAGAPASTPSARSLDGHSGEQALLDDGVDAPIPIHHLRHPEVDGDGNQRNRLILAQALGFH